MAGLLACSTWWFFCLSSWLSTLRMARLLAADLRNRHLEGERQSEGKLLGAGRDEWLWPLPGLLEGAKGWGVSFRRGFADTLSLPLRSFVENAPIVFRYQPIVRVKLTVCASYCGRSYHGNVFYDGDLATGASRMFRIPGVLFGHLDKVGYAVDVCGDTAKFAESINGADLISRAAVALGRSLAGLPPLDWETWKPDRGPPEGWRW